MLNIYTHVSAAQEGIEPNTIVVKMLDVLLSIILFPKKALYADFILSSSMQWLFIPAIIINALIWWVVIVVSIKLIKQRKLEGVSDAC